MGFLNWFEKKLTGDIETDYGSLSGDGHGLAVSASLRRRPDGKRYLVFKWEGPSTLRWEAMEVTPAVLTRLAAIIEDVTKRVGR